MLRLFSAFPAGLPGVGLLLLRLVVGIITVVQSILYLTSNTQLTAATVLLAVVALVSGGMLSLGFLTPVAGTLLALGSMGVALSRFSAVIDISIDGAVSAVFSAIVSVAIVLLGPGAISVDARLFGRREIVIPAVRPPR